MSLVQRPKPSRLPLAAAAFVALVCTIILAIAVVWEWTSRKDHLAAAKVSMANLARSLTQHVEDSFDLLDTSILGVVSRLETDGPTPDTLSKLQKILIARKAGSKRIHMLGITDEKGNWLVSSGAEGENLLESDFLSHHRQSRSREAFVGSAARSLSDGDDGVAPLQPSGRQLCGRGGGYHQRRLLFRLLQPVRHREDRHRIAAGKQRRRRSPQAE